MNGIGRTQKHSSRQLFIDLQDERKDVLVLREPMECPVLDVRLYLTDKGSKGYGSDGPLSKFAMKGSDHFSLPMRGACDVIGCCQRPNSICARILVVEPYEVARIEVDHRISRSRSWLMLSVESVPPRRCLRCFRNARVNLGSAKNGLAGTGEAGTILAMSCPRSVT